MAKFNFILALRIVQIVLSLVVLGLSGFGRLICWQELGKEYELT
jgi:hypothetical protein